MSNNVKIKPLYMATSFEGLKAFTEAKKVPDDKSSYAEKMFQTAQAKGLEGDQEKCYVLFMLYLSVITMTGKKDGPTNKKIMLALKSAEKLKPVLQTRYKEREIKEKQKEAEKLQTKTENERKERQKLNKLHQDTDYALRPQDLSLEAAAPRQNNDASVFDAWMDSKEYVAVDSMPVSKEPHLYFFLRPKELIAMLSEEEQSALLVDIRPEVQYQQARLKFPFLINITEDVLNNKSLSFESILACLNERDKRKFESRSSFSNIIILDRNLTSQNALNHPTLSIARSLIGFLSIGVNVSQKFYILDGGFKGLLIQYPSFCSCSGSGGGGGGDIGGNRVIVSATSEVKASKNISFPLLPNDPLALLSIASDVDASSSVIEYPSVPNEEEFASIEKIMKHVGECVLADDQGEQELNQTPPPIMPKIDRAKKPLQHDVTHPSTPSPKGRKPEEENSVDSTLPPRPPKPKQTQPERPPKPQPQPQQPSQPAVPFISHKNNELSNIPTKLTLSGKAGLGLTGLQNMGNTCYMNSIIQCLSNTMPFSVYFINKSYQQHINKSNPLGMFGELAEEFGNLMSVLWCGKFQYIRPTSIKSCISKFAPRFSGNLQHDSQELLSFLMDGLHEDLNKSYDRTYKEEEDLSNLPAEERAVRSWENHKRRNDSVIVDLFQGQYRSSVTCKTCRFQSLSFTPFMFLSLPVPAKKQRIDLHECLKLFTEPELVTGANQWYCSKCKTHRDAIKVIDIWKLPMILIVHFKRFQVGMDGQVKGKIETDVMFPIQGLNMKDYTKGMKNAPLYSLNSVSCHFGNLTSGHYVSYCKNVFDERWRLFDDSQVKSASASDTQNKSAYVLYYSRMEMNVKLSK